MLKVEDCNGILICSLNSRHLDIDEANNFLKEINKTLEDPIDQILIDFSGVRYVSSAGIKVLFHLAKTMETKQGTTSLCCVDNKIKKIFKLTTLDKIIPIYENRDQALASFSGALVER